MSVHTLLNVHHDLSGGNIDTQTSIQGLHQSTKHWFSSKCEVSNNQFFLTRFPPTFPRLLVNSIDLPMWSSGQSTQIPCAVKRDALMAGVQTSAPGTSAYQRIISNNSYAHDEQGDNLGQEKEGSTVTSINCDHCRHLD